MKRVLIFALCMMALHAMGQQCYDPDFPEMTEFMKAGVRGGIPDDLSIVQTLSPGDDLQATLNQVSGAGGGVVLLKEGTYSFSNTIKIPSNVVLRGESRSGTILRCLMRSTGKTSAVLFENATKAGLENLTVTLDAGDIEPIDRKNRTDGGWCGDCFKNNPSGAKDLYVRLVHVNGGSSDCWVKDCDIIKSGTDPVLLEGKHNTFKNNVVDRCFNKGSGGNGYYDVRGSYNLIEGETVKRIRHFAIQQGAEYNVVTKCYFEVDINFHNKDKGRNLVEDNKIFLATWHGWNIFSTGGASYGHTPPGDRNILFNNKTKYKWEAENVRFADPNVVYTFTTYGDPKDSGWDVPPCGTFLLDPNAAGNELSIDTQPVAVTVCENGEAEFSVKATNGTAYRWYFKGKAIHDNSYYSGTNTNTLKVKKAAKTKQGAYSVKVSGIQQGLTMDSESGELTINDLPAIQPFGNLSAEEGKSVTLEVELLGQDIAGHTFQWFSSPSEEADPVIMDGESEKSLSFTPKMNQNGHKFGVKVTGPQGCSAMSNMASISVFRLLDAQSQVADITVLPNPAERYVSVRGMEEGDVEIYTLDGRFVLSVSAVAGGELDLGDVNPGTYILRTVSGETVSQTRLVLQ
ncbi:hypothetical protein FUAX_47270 (plasmid) [Fulvitalea axinellae]|uniref:Por secretion system C-terminal sorting domain-containing protein n=1 Tax=Fulvitalea axinellae TaxID=1182444 RepID=A0AAU9DM73_9BACT|nr:hypothetical protein FUAX_47270 [Fulvitalea axinellae]